MSSYGKIQKNSHSAVTPYSRPSGTSKAKVHQFVLISDLSETKSTITVTEVNKVTQTVTETKKNVLMAVQQSNDQPISDHEAMVLARQLRSLQEQQKSVEDTYSMLCARVDAHTKLHGTCKKDDCDCVHKMYAAHEQLGLIEKDIIATTAKMF